ncbi:hypothetical protein [Candidatus Venteria ishoeyi]|uniref:Zinc resistance-associated protein n=1 Tax=Candidatus Venteria ishoeyi TaxID=1899563 RepID=A0A1H6FFG5_9GAMM|nr:hypothetical protein [Candidatus Venteria ishoeyi]SEH08767.1 Uncharacterised protein [Candidatus Venteria ishoeyi]
MIKSVLYTALFSVALGGSASVLAAGEVAPAVAAPAPVAAPVAAPAPVAPVAPVTPATPAADNSAAKSPRETMQDEEAKFMQSMHERMAKMWSTEDPAERKKLMDEQKQAMQAHQQKKKELYQQMSGQYAAERVQNWHPGNQMGRGMGRRGMGPGMGRGMGPGMGQGQGMGKGMHRPMCQQHQAGMIERLDRIERQLEQLSK